MLGHLADGTLLSIEWVIENFDKKLRTAVGRYQIEDPVEDLVHAVYLKLITPAPSVGTTYLERFDPNKYSISTYLYGFVNNHCNKVFRREHCSVGTAMAHAVRLDAPIQKDSEEGDSMLDILMVYELMPEAERNLIRDSIIAALNEPEFARFSSFSSDGSPRSIQRMATMVLRDGLTPSEVAEKLEVSVTFVRKQLKRLGKSAKIQAAARDLGFSAA